MQAPQAQPAPQAPPQSRSPVDRPQVQNRGPKTAAQAPSGQQDQTQPAYNAPAFDPDGKMGGGQPPMGAMPNGAAVSPNAPGQPPSAGINASGVNQLAEQVAQNEAPSDPLGLGLNRDDYRMLLDWGLATTVAGAQPGATAAGALGAGGQAALQGRDERQTSRAEAAREERELSIEEQQAQTERAKSLVEMAKAQADSIKSVETVSGGRLVGITESGRRMNLGLKSHDSVQDAMDNARRVATAEVSDGMGGTTTQFDTQVYNQLMTSQGHLEGTVGPIRPPLTEEGKLDRTKLKTGQLYQVPNGRVGIYLGGDQFEVVSEPETRTIDGVTYVKRGGQWYEANQ